MQLVEIHQINKFKCKNKDLIKELDHLSFLSKNIFNTR